MGQKTISSWTPQKQALLNEIKAKTGKSDSETIRQALGVYQLFLAFVNKYDELTRAKKAGRPKKRITNSRV